MDLQGWDQRYRTAARPAEDFNSAPTPLLVETAKAVKPGKALDLACGAGRNALWLAEHGWSVTAVDGAAAAIEILRNHTAQRDLRIDTRVADLEKREYRIESSQWDLIVIAYYLQRDLFEPAKRGVKPGGLLLVIVHIPEPGEESTRNSLPPGELRKYFDGWEVLHSYEGKPVDDAHRRSVAEIVARRPPQIP
jgi:tellurite methyltransferase